MFKRQSLDEIPVPLEYALELAQTIDQLDQTKNDPPSGQPYTLNDFLEANAWKARSVIVSYGHWRDAMIDAFIEKMTKPMRSSRPRPNSPI